MKRILLALLLALCCAGCGASDGLSYAAPSSLPGVTREMSRPGFWIARHPSPDKVIMDRRQIEKFNLSIDRKFPVSVNGDTFRASQSEILKALESKGFYRAGYKRADEFFYGPILENMSLKNVPAEIRPKYGFVTGFANQRILPTNESLYEKPNDIDFDELQNSGLGIGTPVAILHESSDGKWSYVQGPASDGWIESDKLGTCAPKDIETFCGAQKKVVVTDAKADIYLDPALKDYYGCVRMGTSLPYVGNEGLQAIKALVPVRKNSGAVSFRECYIRADSVNDGYLPYTARNIYQQAFKLLNEPYGWGDTRGQPDCSSFIQQVFAAVGVNLPRNSADQSKIGLPVAGFGRAVGGITLLHMKGHIMLFLGAVDNSPYAIHATWGYRENTCGHDSVRLINRVVVSDLSLGNGSSKGSLLERLTGMAIVEDLKQGIISEFENKHPTQWSENAQGVKTRLDTDKNVVALTLDACGSKDDGYDSRLIDYLIKNNIPATLFINARWIDKNPQIFKRLAENPLFEIGNHGAEHKPCSVDGRYAYGIKGTASVGEVVDEIEQNGEKIKALTGKQPKYYRSGTAYYDEVGVKIAERLGYQVAGFSVLGDKGATYSRKQVKDALLSSTAGSIIICHMNHPEKETAAGVIDAIPELKKRGFTFVKLSDYNLK